jgi:uncharacterized repeat protein (TIGR03803 family)
VNIRNRLKPLAACMPLTVLALPVLATPAAAQYQVLLNFEGLNGSIPIAPLTADKAGNLYGTTRDGGSTNCSFGDGCGEVFELTADDAETVLYSFTGGNDGAEPDGQLTLDGAGNLYSVTYNGGAADYGVVFKLAPDGTETVLHTFAGGTNDGIYPHGGVLRDKKGRLFGTTEFGGAYNYGTVFELKPNGKMKILHSFDGTDGKEPEAGLVRDDAGNFYGTTLLGGAYNLGAVFKIAPDGSETVLYSFMDGTDGGEPTTSLVLDKAGNLYGTALIGGYESNGVVFEIAPSGAETVLYTFTGGADGGVPTAALSRDNKGNLYGTTRFGGLDDCPSGCGVVFKVAPDGKETVLHAFEGGTEGDEPLASLIKNPATGGTTLYGTGSGLGTQGAHGVVFKTSK